MTTIADFIGSHPLLILSHRGTNAFPGVLFPLEDGFVTVGAPPGPGSWETGKDAHVIRGPWRISVDRLVVDDDRGRFVLHPPELREHIARAEEVRVSDPEVIAERRRYALFWFPELENDPGPLQGDQTRGRQGRSARSAVNLREHRSIAA